jgi:hypothetical protein
LGAGRGEDDFVVREAVEDGFGAYAVVGVVAGEEGGFGFDTDSVGEGRFGARFGSLRSNLSY